MRVAPREIVDLVERAARLRMIDPAGAAAAGRETLAAEVAGVGGIRAFLAGKEIPGAPVTRERWSGAYREGVTVHDEEFARLEAAASAFLVAESVLDSIASDSG